MKKIHVEFDLLVTDADYDFLMDASEICLQDNIMESLSIYDDCESIDNFQMIFLQDEI